MMHRNFLVAPKRIAGSCIEACAARAVLVQLHVREPATAERA